MTVLVTVLVVAASIVAVLTAAAIVVGTALSIVLSWGDRSHG